MAHLVLGVDSINKIVNDYNGKHKKMLNNVLTAHSALPKTQQTNSFVRGLHRVNSKFQLGHMHQNRIRKDKKESAINALNSVTCPPSHVKDFEDLFEWVYEILRNNGVIKNRCLWVYDIALRMGQCMTPKIEPQEYVYLYKGAYEGAVALNKILPKGSQITIKNNRAPISSFPPVLQRLGTIDIENIMCIYHP